MNTIRSIEEILAKLQDKLQWYPDYFLFRAVADGFYKRHVEDLRSLGAHDKAQEYEEWYRLYQEKFGGAYGKR